jgi:hypothetical protein
MRLFRHHLAECQIGFASKPAATNAVIPPPPCRMTDRIRQQAGSYECDHSADTVPNDRSGSPASRLLRTRLFRHHRAECQIGFASKPAPTNWCGYNVNIALRAGVSLWRTGKTTHPDQITQLASGKHLPEK